MAHALQVNDARAKLGDPVIVRRDGAPSYALVSVIDDACDAMNQVVRGRDLLPSALLQQAIADVVVPVMNQQRQPDRFVHYALAARYHPLVLESHISDKWSKFHGAVAVPELRQSLQPEALCGQLLHAFGIGSGVPITPSDAVADFSWAALTSHDVPFLWNGRRLEIADSDT